MMFSVFPLPFLKPRSEETSLSPREHKGILAQDFCLEGNILVSRTVETDSIELRDVEAWEVLE